MILFNRLKNNRLRSNGLFVVKELIIAILIILDGRDLYITQHQTFYYISG